MNWGSVGGSHGRRGEYRKMEDRKIMFLSHMFLFLSHMFLFPSRIPGARLVRSGQAAPIPD